MKLTNNYGAPDSIVDAIRNDSYTKDGADFSVTELIKPPQIRRLWNEHEEDISVDVNDEMFKLLGTAVHNLLDSAPKCGQCDGTGDCWSGEATHELWWTRPITTWDKLKAWTRGASCDPCDSCDGTGVIDDGKIREKRFHANHNGTTISGAIDLIDPTHGEVTDYKVTSAYSVKKGLKEDWEKQLNLYAWLLRQNGITANKLQIVAICRDWTKSRVGKYDYPDSMVVVLSVPMWRDGRQDDYVDQRVRVHTQESTIPCTPEERWARGAYQVNPTHSKGGKPRSFDTMREATDHINGQKTGSYIIKDGDATYVRCESWCEVAPFCPQWKGDKGNGR